jgi:hypothetical protein
MIQLHLLSKEERSLYFTSAAEAAKMSFEIVEKDFWVVWTLDRLFSLPELKSHLTLKGGTSLSKIYGIIERFSEDIDVSIEREFLGFDESKNPENASSKSKQQDLLKGLSASCAQYIKDQLLDKLLQVIAKELKTSEGWKLYIDETDDLTILFEYPSITAAGGYIRPIVKIEMGARAEHWPVSNHPIKSYAKEALGNKMTEPQIIIRVLNAERTFWEKATILHQHAHLPESKKTPLRLSRHYYDFYRLLNSPAKDIAINDLALLERVAIHKNIYFASAWANYGTAKKGTLKLSPSDRIIDELKADYNLMDTMFFRGKPDWNFVLEAIKSFETTFNK